MKVPNRWLNYSKSSRIHGTRFVAFKTPLNKEFPASMAKKRFTPKDLLRAHPEIKLVIDLTYTTKYYKSAEEFEKNGVEYLKIRCKGHVVPDERNFKIFAEKVNEFLEKNSQNCFLIGVHCTHGVNRTGYFVVRYMIEYLGYTPIKALNEFLKSRGHAVERTNYIADIRRRKKL